MNLLTSITVEPNDVFADIFGMIDAAFFVAEFDLKGNVIRVNDNFLSLTGYHEEEVLGQHHSLFLSDDVAAAPEYDLCWVDLCAGKSKSVILPWVTKTGELKWVEETVGPVKDRSGKVIRIVRIGVDVTDQHDILADLQGKVGAIDHSQAVVEFDPAGNIQNVNSNFLTLTGYDPSEVIGNHHDMLLDPDFARSAESRAFWRSLVKGKTIARQVKNIGKDGREVWFEASYGPVYGPDGKLCKIVKFANDITDKVASLRDLKTVLETGFDEADHAIARFDQSYETVSTSWRKAHAHMEVSAMVAARLVSSVDETAQRMTELRSVADCAFDHAIESDAAVSALEEAIDVLRDCARDDPAIIKQIDVLEKCIDASARISTTVRADINAMLCRVAVVSLAVDQQAEITHQVRGEMHGIQTVLETTQRPLEDMTNASENIAMIVGRGREASAVLER